MEIGVERPLEFNDLPAMSKKHLAHHNAETFESAWKEQLARNPTQPSMGEAIYQIYRSPFLFSGFLKLIADGLSFFSPILLEFLIQFVADTNSKPNPPNVSVGVGIAIAMFVVATLQTVITNVYFKLMSTCYVLFHHFIIVASASLSCQFHEIPVVSS